MKREKPDTTRPLPASAFRANDRVVGSDAGGTHFGVVQETPQRHLDVGEILVKWTEAEYDDSSRGNLVPADLVQLWPARLHAERLQALPRSTP